MQSEVPSAYRHVKTNRVANVDGVYEATLRQRRFQGDRSDRRDLGCMKWSCGT